MPEMWMPGADRDGRAWRQNSMSRTTDARRAVLHTSENRTDTDPKAVANYVWNHAGSSTGYHLFVPLTTRYRPLQLRPANVAAGSLRNNGSLRVSPNREGSILIQICLVAYAADAHAASDLGPWWPQVLDWVRSWGVPDVIVGGRLPAGGGRTNTMPLTDWYSDRGGWSFHATAPNPPSTHWDPGKADPAVLLPPRTPTTAPYRLQEDAMLVKSDDDDHVYLLAGGRLVWVRTHADMLELQKSYGEYRTVSAGTMSNLKAAYPVTDS